MRTLIPSITVISFTSEDLIGFSSTGAKLQDDPEDEDEDVALRVLFLKEGATGGGGWPSPRGRIQGEDYLLLRLDLFCSGDTRGEWATVPLSGRVTGEGVREILPEGWRVSSLKLLGDTARMKSSILLMYLSNSSWALLPRIPSDRLTTSILRELEYFSWHDVLLSLRGKINWQPV